MPDDDGKQKLEQSKLQLLKDDKAVRLAKNLKGDSGTLSFSKLSRLDQVAEAYENIKPERTFGYGETSKSSDLAGQVLKGKYKIINLLGEGGGSNVYLCERILVGDRVALKMLFANLAADPVKAKRFHLEATTTASIKHPNVIIIYDFDFTDEGLPFIVTELLRGLTLFGLLQQSGRLTLRRALQIITPICSALNVAHARGIVHRDLKPSNVVLHRMDDNSEVVKLIDFGIAKRLLNSAEDVITSPGIVFGTPAYMSPEHCLGEQLDGRSDIYSLGVLLFEMLTGCLPFEAESPTKLMLKHIKDRPPTMRNFNPDINPSIESIVLRALSKEPGCRFNTALEFADLLNHSL